MSMSRFQHIAKAATIAIAVLLTAPFAAAEQAGRYWVPETTSRAPYWGPTTANPAQYSEPAATPPYSGPTSPAPFHRPRTMSHARHVSSMATKSTKPFATAHTRKRSHLAAMAQSVPHSQTHRLILQ